MFKIAVLEKGSAMKEFYTARTVACCNRVVIMWPIFLHLVCTSGTFCIEETCCWVLERSQYYDMCCYTQFYVRKHPAETYVFTIISLLGPACSDVMGFVQCMAVVVYPFDLVCKISTYHFHSSVRMFVLPKCWRDLDNIWY